MTKAHSHRNLKILKYYLKEIDMSRPSRCTVRELSKVGVSLEDESRLILRCKTCKTGWMVNLLSEGILPKGYWKCPNKCNEKHM